jgi:hypothetical protein
MDPSKSSNNNNNNNNNKMSQQQQSKSHHFHHHHQQHHQQQTSSSSSQSSSNMNESKFYSLSSIEVKDQLELMLEEAYGKLNQLIANSTQGQASSSVDTASFNELSQYANQTKAHYDEVCNALLYAILIDPFNAPRYLRNLFLCNNLAFNFGGKESTSSVRVNILDLKKNFCFKKKHVGLDLIGPYSVHIHYGLSLLSGRFRARSMLHCNYHARKSKCQYKVGNDLL